MPNIEKLREKAKQLRKDVLRMTTKAGTGHVTSSFSSMELMVALYYGGILKQDIKNPKWEGRDYFILSKGHANPALYCILADRGYFESEKLELFCQPQGELGVLLRGSIPGAEITSGSLGCGLGIAAGIAHALQLDQKRNKVYCFLGDAECREGAVWEAAMHIGYRKLNNLVVIIDRNNLGATHFVEKEAGLEPLDEKWAAFQFEVSHINGHHLEEILDALCQQKRKEPEKPFVLIADTVKGKGVSFLENIPLLHGAAVPESKLQAAIKEIDEGF